MKADKPYIVLFEIGSSKLRGAFATREDSGRVLLHDVQVHDGRFMERGRLCNIDNIKFAINRMWDLLSNSCHGFGHAYLCMSNSDDNKMRQANLDALNAILTQFEGTNRHLNTVENPLSLSVERLTTEEERRRGCLYIDLGGGNTHVQCYCQGKNILRASLPVGGCDITADIAGDIGLPTAQAEQLKIKCGEADADQVKKAYIRIKNPQTNDSTAILSTDLSRRIEERLTADCLSPYLKALKARGFFESKPMDIILAGGGSRTTNLDGLLAKLCPGTSIRHADAAILLAADCQDKYNQPELCSMLGALHGLELFHPPRKGGIFERMKRKTKPSETPVPELPVNDDGLELPIDESVNKGLAYFWKQE